MKQKKILLTGLLLLVLSIFISAKNQTHLKKPEIGLLINVIDHDYEKITNQQLAEISKAGYKTIELGAYNKSLSPRFLNTCSDLKFNSLAIGSNLHDFKDNIDQWIEKALTLKMKYLICYWPWLDGAEHITREQCMESAKILETCGEKCSKAGLKFAFHNHGIEFGKIEDEFIADILLKNTDSRYVSLELDIYHMLKSGIEPIPFMERNAGRIPILHLFAMDSKGKYPLVGEGMSNFKKIIGTAKKIGVDYLIIEGNDLEDPLRFIKESYPVLQSFLTSTLKKQLPDNLEINIEADGSASLKGAGILLSGIYPTLDDKPVYALERKITHTDNSTKIVFKIDNKKELELTYTNDSSSFIIQTILRGFEMAPEIVQPLGNALVKNADRYFKQGLGFGGPSGVLPFQKPKLRQDTDTIFENVWSNDSYMLSALITPDEQTLAMTIYDTKKFTFRTTFSNRQTRFGLVDRWLDENKIYCSPTFITENIPLNGKDLKLPDIHIISGKTAFVTCQTAARNVAAYNKVTLKQANVYGWCSWYEMEKNFDEKTLLAHLKQLKSLSPALPITTIQIDDGYSLRGDWLIERKDKFPSGLKYAFKAISDAGYRPGVWVGPFMVSEKSEVFKNHQDWLLHDKSGQLIKEYVDDLNGRNYLLDTSNPEAFEYLRSVFRSFYKMGVRYYKTDFMDWGLRNSGTVTRFKPGKSSVEYFVEVLNMIRQEIGPESFWLGCIAPFAPMIGYADGMRVSNDVGRSWTKYSHRNMVDEMFACQYFNNIYWQNDPDVIYLGTYETEFDWNVKRTIDYWGSFLGGMVYTSDRFGSIKSEDLRLFRFIQPSQSKQIANLPLWSKPINARVAVREFGKGNFAMLFVNPQDYPLNEKFALKDLSGVNNLEVFNWSDKSAEYIGKLDTLQIKLQPHHFILYYGSFEKVPPPTNLGLNGTQIP